MYNLNKALYAVFDTKQQLFVYSDMGTLRWANLPKKSSVREDLFKARDLCDRYEFYLDKAINDAVEELREAKGNGPEYDMWKTRAIAQKYFDEDLKRLTTELAAAKKERKTSKFAVVELSMKIS